MMYRTTIVLFTLLGCTQSQEDPTAAKAGATPKLTNQDLATRVEVAVLSASQSDVMLQRPGEVEGAREANLAAALGGLVERVLIKSGDTVKENQVIARIDSTVHSGESKLTSVELDEAQREYDRLQSLGKAIAAARLDAAKTRLARAQAQHSLSRTRQGRGLIRAPFAGVIVGLDVERGEVAAPGATIARLVQLSPAHVSVSVTDRDVAGIKVGDDAEVFTAGSATPRKGKVYRIEPAADLKTRTFLVVVEVDNDDKRLLPGMMARVAFSSVRDSASLLIPQDFLVTQLDENGVFVVDRESVARWRPLTLGSIIGTNVEVIDGIAVGDRVVVVGQRGLKPGDRVSVTREGQCCTNGRVTYSMTNEKAPAEPAAEPENARQAPASAKPQETTSDPSAEDAK